MPTLQRGLYAIADLLFSIVHCMNLQYLFWLCCNR